MMTGWFAPRLLAVSTLMLASPAGALTSAPPPGGAAAAIPVLLVCDPDGCRHRFKGYRARPNWKGYWARQAQDGLPAERVPTALRSHR